MPAASAIARHMLGASSAAASSAKTTPAGNEARTALAVASARVVLPAPPGPVIDVNRDWPISSITRLQVGIATDERRAHEWGSGSDRSEQRRERRTAELPQPHRWHRRIDLADSEIGQAVPIHQHSCSDIGQQCLPAVRHRRHPCGAVDGSSEIVALDLERLPGVEPDPDLE